MVIVVILVIVVIVVIIARFRGTTSGLDSGAYENEGGHCRGWRLNIAAPNVVIRAR